MGTNAARITQGNEARSQSEAPPNIRLKRPVTPPMTGKYTSATTNEAESTKISVTGNIPMNCPGTPGQKSIGRNAQSVVAVDEMIGQNMRFAASVYAAIGPEPSLIFLSAYSTTTIAPSTSIPTARIRPNITMFEIVISITAKRAKHKRKDVGIAKPTNKAGLVPKAARTTIITNAIAVRTEPSSWLTIDATLRD